MLKNNTYNDNHSGVTELTDDELENLKILYEVLHND